ncbi:MAG: hypothetical protein HUU57_16600, partial [Bdellovibrio sp.]|nr:hypothetical protein [Bdellovibrio sp.]
MFIYAEKFASKDGFVAKENIKDIIKRVFLPFKKERFLFLLSVSLFVPSVLFFIWHKYRVNFYNVPVLGGVTTALCLLVLTSSGVAKVFYKTAFSLTGVLFFLLG